MPFNGSGTYNLPAGNPVSSGTPISSTTHNATNNDIASALTNCLTRDGQSPATANINFGGYKITNLGKGTAAGDAVRFQQVAKIDETTGANTDIKSITGLTTMLATNQGGTGVSTSTGTGANVLSNSPTLSSPTLVTPALGTPASGNLANCTFPTLNQNTTGSAATATNLAGGGVKQLVYQTAIGTTGFIANVPSKTLVTDSAGNISWGNLNATNLLGGAAGRIPYQSAVDTTLFTAAGTAGQFLKSNGTSAPSWENLSVTTEQSIGGNTYIGYSLYPIGLSGTGNNVCLGAYIAPYATSGGSNVIIGNQSLQNATIPNNCIVIGTAAGNDAVANITTQSNYIVLGNNTVTNANIKVAWTVTSDARDKTNFSEIPHGLDFVNQLKPTAYQFKLNRESDDVGENARVRYGFKAQDILELEGNNPVIINNEDIDNLKYNESCMIPVLVKAIQELTTEVNKLKGV